MRWDEQWKDIIDYEGIYQVSNLGRIKRLPTVVKRSDGKYKKVKETILKPYINKSNVPLVSISKNGCSKTLVLYRLEAIAFIPNPLNKPQVNHIDGNRLNNKINNLEWATSKKNIIHGYKNGLYKNVAISIRKRLSKKVNQYSIEGELIKIWDCMTDIQRELKINQRNISECCLGKRKTAGKYVWKFSKGDKHGMENI